MLIRLRTNPALVTAEKPPHRTLRPVLRSRLERPATFGRFPPRAPEPGDHGIRAGIRIGSPCQPACQPALRRRSPTLPLNHAASRDGSRFRRLRRRMPDLLPAACCVMPEVRHRRSRGLETWAGAWASDSKGCCGRKRNQQDGPRTRTDPLLSMGQVGSEVRRDRERERAAARSARSSPSREPLPQRAARRAQQARRCARRRSGAAVRRVPTPSRRSRSRP